MSEHGGEAGPEGRPEPEQTEGPDLEPKDAADQPAPEQTDPAKADPPGPPPARRRRALAAVLAAGVLAAGAAGAAVAVDRAGQQDRPAAPAASATATPTQPESLAPIQALLARRSAAVKRKDRTAFLADIDTRDPRFVNGQRQLFDNLTRLPVGAWTYRALPQGEFNRPELATRYGARVRAQAVVLRYSLKGFDRGDVARPLIYTFVQRDGRWLLGGDADLDDLLPPGGHAEPWDVQPIAVVRGRSSLVIGPRTQTAQLRTQASMVDRAVGKVAAMWPSGWSRKVVVIAASDPRVIATYFRGESKPQLANTAAIHVPTFSNLFGWYGSGFPTGGPTGDRIIVNPRAHVDRKGLPLLLTHEITHQATQPLQRGGEPTWLVEGAAEYTAYREFPLRRLRLPKAVRRAAADGIDFLPSDTTFYSRDVDFHYMLSWLACAYIADRYGEPRLRQFYARLAANENDTAVSEAEDRAFADVLGTDREHFLAGLSAFIRRISA